MQQRLPHQSVALEPYQTMYNTECAAVSPTIRQDVPVLKTDILYFQCYLVLRLEIDKLLQIHHFYGSAPYWPRFLTCIFLLVKTPNYCYILTLLTGRTICGLALWASMATPTTVLATRVSIIMLQWHTCLTSIRLPREHKNTSAQLLIFIMKNVVT